ncbi:MAG: manganese efflux pump MntP family protein [Bifidobacterium sp.]|nr:manganese efflux pump MntP family protein [Bifidobacterium sp.]MCI1865122.1 manganese efflux pump MntP family protein [Bifidobacterium sp.]
MFVELLLIPISVSLDAFAVSLSKGLSVRRVLPIHALKTALWFGGLQALFPLLGFYAASVFSQYVTSASHWIIFGLLTLVGANMIREALSQNADAREENVQFDWRHMLPLAVACSIDAFAIGVSFTFMKVNIILSVAIIGIVTGLFSVAGLHLGHVCGARWQQPAQIAGGAILIAIGIKVVLEDFGIITF